MADGTDPGATTDPGNGGSNGAATTDAPRTFTQDQVNDLIAREKGKVQNQFADYDDLKAAATRLAEIEESKKTTEQKLAGERDTFKGQAETLTQQNARLKVALKKGLVGDKADLADRLMGKDERELEADADRLLALFGNTAATDFDGGARGGTPKSGDMNEFIRAGARRNRV